MSRMNSGFIQRKHLSDALTSEIESVSKIPVNAGDNQAYEIGKALGYTDGLKKAQSLLNDLDDEPRPAPAAAWHQQR